MTRIFLRSFVQTVGLPQGSFEILLVDDCSRESAEMFVKEFSVLPIRYLRNDENCGFGESNNRGASEANGEFLILLNNDLKLKPGWLEPMLGVFDNAEHRAGAVGNIQINTRTRLIDHAGVAFGSDGVPFHARKNRLMYPKGNIAEWPAVTAACMLIRRTVFWEVGGFDTAYRNGSEDIDLCMRLRVAGYHNYVSNSSRVYHHISSSPGRHEFNEQNLEIFMGRWRREGEALGSEMWPREYLFRYARHWWKLSPIKFFQACVLLCFRRTKLGS